MPTCIIHNRSTVLTYHTARNYLHSSMLAPTLSQQCRYKSTCEKELVKKWPPIDRDPNAIASLVSWIGKLCCFEYKYRRAQRMQSSHCTARLYPSEAIAKSQQPNQSPKYGETKTHNVKTTKHSRIHKTHTHSQTLGVARNAPRTLESEYLPVRTEQEE